MHTGERRTMDIVLEPCTASDADFAFRVTEETIRTYVEQAFGSWDVGVQRRRCDESFDPTTYRVIVVDGVRAGILAVEDRPFEIFLSKIFLLPTFQRRGIGSLLIRELIESAEASRKPMRLRVLRVNPARFLYERLGFHVTHSTPDHEYMEYPSTKP
jgi:ribosomal protein S18 acetylase RimI-like enzyme